MYTQLQMTTATDIARLTWTKEDRGNLPVVKIVSIILKEMEAGLHANTLTDVTREERLNRLCDWYGTRGPEERTPFYATITPPTVEEDDVWSTDEVEPTENDLFGDDIQKLIEDAKAIGKRAFTTEIVNPSQVIKFRQPVLDPVEVAIIAAKRESLDEAVKPRKVVHTVILKEEDQLHIERTYKFKSNAIRSNFRQREAKQRMKAMLAKGYKIRFNANGTTEYVSPIPTFH